MADSVPPGRYLSLALLLKGPGDRTPKVERLYVYGQRRSSLQYLPAVYQADETSRDVLDRLLSLFDTIFGEIESDIEDFIPRLDVDGAPLEFLPWLASWFDLTLLSGWDEAKRRGFLRKIVELYRWRGTIRGLRRLLQLHCDLADSDPLPEIVEHYRGLTIRRDDSPRQMVSRAIERWLGLTPIPPSCGDPGAASPAVTDTAYHFTVLLPACALDTKAKRLALARLVEANKPAHTHYSFFPVYAGVRLGSAQHRGAAIGMNSLLGNHTNWYLPRYDPEEETEPVGDGLLGSRTALPPVPLPRAVFGRIGHIRVGATPLGRRHCPPCNPEENAQ